MRQQPDRVLGPTLTEDERAQLVSRARKCVGRRFQHQGRGDGAIDCAGLCAYAMKPIRKFRDVRGYGRNSTDTTLAQALQDNLGDPVPRESMQAGDIVLMQFGSSPSHLGIVGDYPYGGLSLIHSFAPKHKVIEHRIDDEWMRRIVQVYRP